MRICIRCFLPMWMESLAGTSVLCQVSLKSFIASSFLIQLTGRNYCTLGEYDPNQDPEVEGLCKASSRIGKLFRSNTQKKGTGFLGKSKQDTADSSQGANTADALEVILRVEVNQKNPDGATKPYRLIIPPLTTQSYDATASAYV